MDCFACNFNTKRISDWKRHISTEKHIFLCNKNITCYLCLHEFASKSSLCTHKKKCIMIEDKKIDTKNNNFDDALELKLKISDLEHKLEMAEMKGKLKDAINKVEIVEAMKKAEIAEVKVQMYKEFDVKYEKKDIETKEIAKESLKAVNKTVNALTYVMNNYTDAPLLLKYDKHKEKMNEFFSKKKKLIEYDSDDNELDLHDLKTQSSLVLKYELGNLDNYLVELIESIHKSDDPSKQSFWFSDLSRLSGIVRQIVGDKPKWVRDKKGIEITKYVIDPLLDTINELMREYIELGTKKESLCKDKYDEKLVSIDQVMYASQIISSIRDRSLHEKILEKLAKTEAFIFNKDKCEERSNEIKKKEKNKLKSKK